MSMRVKVALVQMSMGRSSEENLQKAIRMIKEAGKKGANIVCLPELFDTPYFPQEEKAEAEAFAHEIPGRMTEALSKAAKDSSIVLVAGSIFERHGKKFFNTTAVFDENGKMLGSYRKMHIPHDPNFFEQNYFERGDLGYRVFDTKYGRIGTLICYDQWYPEAARTLALMGADIIFYPTAIGWVDGVEPAEGNWQEAWEAVQRGHGIANATAICSVNRVGREGSMIFWGGSFIYSQFGTLLAHGDDKEGLVMGEIDTDLGSKVKEGWRFFYNRRPETYKKLVEK
jgi:predicted amidohydrolase